MRTSLAHCLLCLIVKTPACTHAFINGDTLIYIILPRQSCLTATFMQRMLKLWPCVSCAADRTPRTPTTSLVPTYASGFPFYFFSFFLSFAGHRLKHFTHTVGHSPHARRMWGWKVEGSSLALSKPSRCEVSESHSWGTSESLLFMHRKNL